MTEVGITGVLASYFADAIIHRVRNHVSSYAWAELLKNETNSSSANAAIEDIMYAKNAMASAVDQFDSVDKIITNGRTVKIIYQDISDEATDSS